MEYSLAHRAGFACFYLFWHLFQNSGKGLSAAAPFSCLYNHHLFYLRKSADSSQSTVIQPPYDSDEHCLFLYSAAIIIKYPAIFREMETGHREKMQVSLVCDICAVCFRCTFSNVSYTRYDHFLIRIPLHSCLVCCYFIFALAMYVLACYETGLQAACFDQRQAALCAAKRAAAHAGMHVFHRQRFHVRGGKCFSR